MHTKQTTKVKIELDISKIQPQNRVLKPPHRCKPRNLNIKHMNSNLPWCVHRALADTLEATPAAATPNATRAVEGGVRQSNRCLNDPEDALTQTAPAETGVDGENGCPDALLFDDQRLILDLAITSRTNLGREQRSSERSPHQRQSKAVGKEKQNSPNLTLQWLLPKIQKCP